MQHDGLEFLFAGAGPVDHIHVATEGHLVAILAPEIDDIHSGLGFKRIVGVQTDLDEILKDARDIAAAVIDDRQAMLVTDLDHSLETGLVPLAPIIGVEEQVLAVGHVPPDHHAVNQTVSRLDLGPEQLDGPFVGALDKAPKAFRIEAGPKEQVFWP